MQAFYLEAPFATFRTFTAGWYRPTATFVTPSAAYGLLLNLAGIESRLLESDAAHPGKVPASVTQRGLPRVELAIGVPAYRLRHGIREIVADREVFPRHQTIFQQLHNYPVGTSGAERAESARGNKYNITPIRREYLSDVRAVVVMRGDDDLALRVRQGLRGDGPATRYGIPFLGDNAFLPDRIVPVDDLGPVRWYERVNADSAASSRERTARLTVLIDRADLSRTTSALYAPQAESTTDPPSSLAWTEISPPPH